MPEQPARVFNVLFLCTGNSARSIIAESVLPKEGDRRFRAFCAGSHPKPEVHPIALKILGNLGFPTGGLRSKSWDVFAGPEPRLLDAAHIVEDRHENLGQPIIPNGLPLSKLRHAAFDARLIGIDPDFRLHVSDRLLAQDDGPVLEAMKGLNGQLIHLPKREKDHPDRDRLAQRFETFRSVA